jgi:hypothetical protein
MTDELQLTIEERNLALSVAADLISNGVPVFIAHRRKPYVEGMPEFYLPRNWQKTKPDIRVLDSWRIDSAVCAVTGVMFDVIDVDPRNGGNESFAGMQSAGLVPPIYGAISTPSGGMHYYVARTGVRKGEIEKGVDYQAGQLDGTGRGFVYVTPTMRSSKVTGIPALYAVQTTIDVDAALEGITDPDAEAFRNFVLEKRKSKEVSMAPIFEKRDHSYKEQKYLDATVNGTVAELLLTPQGQREVKLNTASYKMGTLVAGCGLDEAYVTEVLITTGIAMGLEPRDVRYKVPRSIRDGKKVPQAPGPFAQERREEMSFDEWIEAHATGELNK